MAPLSYSVLCVRSDGQVPLRAGHVTRLIADASEDEAPLRARAFEAFAAQARPGVYRISWAEGCLLVDPRPASALQPNQRVRVLRSPLSARVGVVPKQPSPSPYDAVREAGTLTLLTDAAGLVLQEACVAALVAWDGESIVLAPADTARSQSLAEEAIAAELAHRRSPLAVDAGWAIAAANAVAGPFDLALPGRRRFPPAVLRAIARTLAR